MLIGAIWIYFRTHDNYRLLPRRNLLSVLIVIGWIWANYREPLMLPLGLLCLWLYSEKYEHQFELFTN